MNAAWVVEGAGCVVALGAELLGEGTGSEEVWAIGTYSVISLPQLVTAIYTRRGERCMITHNSYRLTTLYTTLSKSIEQNTIEARTTYLLWTPKEMIHMHSLS